MESTEVGICAHPRKGVVWSLQHRPSPLEAEQRGRGVRKALGELLPWSTATEQLLGSVVRNSGRKGCGGNM